MKDYMRFAMMTAGFTGTRRPVSSMQRENLMRVIGDLRLPEGHHGDCINADAEFHFLCRSFAVKLVIHPPSDPRFRAFCPPGLMDEIRDPKPYLARNMDIVTESSFLIAVPDRPRPAGSRGSGTWTTVGYAGQMGMGTIILHPDGRMEVDGRPLVR